MSLLGLAFAVTILLCFMNIGVTAGASSGLRFRKSIGEADVVSNGLFSQSDNEYVPDGNQDLLDVLLARPSKRLWCRKGMTYNHVLGSCTPSFAAMRGKGRRQQL